MNWLDYVVIFLVFFFFVVPSLVFWAVTIYYMFIYKADNKPLTQKEEVDVRERIYDRINH
jgi:hypothetical protein